MTANSVVSIDQSDYRQSPRLDELSVGKQLVVWAIRVTMDNMIPGGVRDALIEEAFLYTEAPQAAKTFLEFIDAALGKAGAPRVFTTDYVSRDELELLESVEPMLRRTGFLIE